MSTHRGKPLLRFDSKKVLVEPNLPLFNCRFRRKQSVSSERIIHPRWWIIKQLRSETAATWRSFRSFYWHAATWNQTTSSLRMPRRSRSFSTWNPGKTEGSNTSVIFLHLQNKTLVIYCCKHDIVSYGEIIFVCFQNSVCLLVAKGISQHLEKST